MYILKYVLKFYSVNFSFVWFWNHAMRFFLYPKIIYKYFSTFSTSYILLNLYPSCLEFVVYNVRLKFNFLLHGVLRCFVTHPFIEQIFSTCLPYAKLCSGCLGDSREWDRKGLSLLHLIFWNRGGRTAVKRKHYWRHC